MGLFKKDIDKESKQKKEAMLKEFKKLLDDVMDNYEKYSEEHKLQVKNALEGLRTLNKTLDQYDPALQNLIEKISKAFSDFFGG